MNVNSHSFEIMGVHSKTRQTLKYRIFLTYSLCIPNGFKLFTGLFYIKYIFMAAFDINLLI